MHMPFISKSTSKAPGKTRTRSPLNKKLSRLFNSSIKPDVDLVSDKSTNLAPIKRVATFAKLRRTASRYLDRIMTSHGMS